MLTPKTEGLGITINKIKRNAIMLPDFQRNFVWKEEETQKKLVASVLTKMPIGSILLLKSKDAHEYSCKQLGAKDTIDSNLLPDGQVEFLLDGQQRMTVLANVFSDAIFQLTSPGKSLIAPSALRRRFYLKLPKVSNPDKGHFGLKSLVFPMRTPASDEPDFLTQDILPYIHAIPFQLKKDKDTCYNPYSRPLAKKRSELVSYCTSTDPDWFYIPLYLLIQDDGSSINHTTLNSILHSISGEIQRTKQFTLKGILDNNQIDVAKQYIKDNLDNEIYEGYFDSSCFDKTPDDIYKSYEEAIETQANTWASKMFTYLTSCVDQINLSQISLDESQRARAIDIYENLNRGGVSLDIFDLIMARVAQANVIPFYKRLEDCLVAGDNYPENVIPSQVVKKAFQAFKQQEKYHAAEYTQCFNSEKNEFPKIYLESFLNVLSLVCYESDYVKSGAFNVEHLKRQKKLNLKADEINNNCERCCTDLDRACYFFQVRCGIRALKEINYTLMFPIVAYIFDKDDHFYGSHNEKIFDLLEAWYWASIFAGSYDKDQNQVMVNDLNKLISNVDDIANGKSPDVAWIKDRRDQVLNVRGFSNRDFLLLGSADLDEYPKTVIGTTICQYFLAQGYEDLLPNAQNEPVQLSVFSECAYSLQVHHVIPLGSISIQESTKSMRSDKKHYLNSPLNFMYITDEANRAISNKSLAEYTQIIPRSAGLSELGFSVVNISATSTDQERKAALQNRHTALEQKIKHRINSLLT